MFQAVADVYSVDVTIFLSFPCLSNSDYIRSSVQQEQLQNKTLFNSLGTLISNKIDWIRNISDENNSLTLSTTKRWTDLGTLVVPFDLNVPPVTWIGFVHEKGNKTSNWFA